MDIPSISAVVAAVGVLVGVTLAYLEVRTLAKQRQTDLVMRLYSTFGSKDFLEARRKVMDLKFEDYSDYVKKYGRFGRFEAVSEVCMFFEGIGVLLHRKLIDIGLVDDLFSSLVKMTWEKMKPLAEATRKKLNRPQMGEYFEYLYNEIRKREQRLQQTQQ